MRLETKGSPCRFCADELPAVNQVVLEYDESGQADLFVEGEHEIVSFRVVRWQWKRCEDCPIARQTSGEASKIKRPPGG